MIVKSREQDIEDFLDRQSQLDTLRFITCGSVDDGKSTLIGRLLWESKTLFDDQVDALKRDSKHVGTQGDDIDFALLVDGLSAEREQGITIDVAYRFFSTDKRRFIVADTPGHEQYTRNMVTGASMSKVAVILIDARQGVLPQTRRHSFIASLLGIRHVVLAINKMDLVGFSHEVYENILSDYLELAKRLSFKSITPIPVSALRGDNIMTRSKSTPWYDGPTLLDFLETVPVHEHSAVRPFRLPVQWVNRSSPDFRGYSGMVESGSIVRGEQVRILPSGETAQIKEIFVGTDLKERALPEQSITITLDREVDVSRGNVITALRSPCEVANQFEASLVWMEQTPGLIGRSYVMQLGTSTVNATLTEIESRTNMHTLEDSPSQKLEFNDISTVKLSLDRALPFDPYNEVPSMGGFILVDRLSNATVAAGMINRALRRSKNVHRYALTIDRRAREKLNGHRGRCIWFTGLSGSGKSTTANALEQALYARGIRSFILDGDNLRHGLNKDLGFTEADRTENIRRVAELAKLMVDAGLVVIASFISPFRIDRELARSLFAKDDFVEIFVDAPLEVAEARDPKGLYRKARNGEILNFTGISSPYERPEHPELTLRTDQECVQDGVERILDLCCRS